MAPPYKVLTNREASILRAVAETMFPSADGSHITPEEARVVEYIDELLAEVEPRERIMMRCMITLFEVQSLVTNPVRPSLFTRASLKVRQRTLNGWDKSNLYPRRLAFQALRSLMMWAYIDNPDVEQSIGIERGTAVIDRLKAKRWSLSREQAMKANYSVSKTLLS